MNADLLKDFHAATTAARISATEAMNILQDNRVISDNCVNPEDIANEDAGMALTFIRGLSFEKKPRAQGKLL